MRFANSVETTSETRGGSRWVQFVSVLPEQNGAKFNIRPLNHGKSWRQVGANFCGQPAESVGGSWGSRRAAAAGKTSSRTIHCRPTAVGRWGEQVVDIGHETGFNFGAT